MYGTAESNKRPTRLAGQLVQVGRGVNDPVTHVTLSSVTVRPLLNKDGGSSCANDMCNMIYEDKVTMGRRTTRPKMDGQREAVRMVVEYLH